MASQAVQPPGWNRWKLLGVAQIDNLVGTDILDAPRFFERGFCLDQSNNVFAFPTQCGLNQIRSRCRFTLPCVSLAAVEE